MTAPVQRKLPGTTLIPGEQLAAQWQDDIYAPSSEVTAGRTGQVRAHILPTLAQQNVCLSVSYCEVFSQIERFSGP